MIEKIIKDNFKKKAMALAESLNEFSKAWEQLEMLTDVDTGNEPFTETGLNGSLDEIASEFEEWADNLIDVKELK